MIKAALIVCTISIITTADVEAEDGYDLWLRYPLISDQQKLADYRDRIQGWMVDLNPLPVRSQCVCRSQSFYTTYTVSQTKRR